MVDLSFDSGQVLEKIHDDAREKMEEKLSQEEAADVFKYGGLASEYNALVEWKKWYEKLKNDSKKIFAGLRPNQLKEKNDRIETLKERLKNERALEIKGKQKAEVRKSVEGQTSSAQIKKVKSKEQMTEEEDRLKKHKDKIEIQRHKKNKEAEDNKNKFAREKKTVNANVKKTIKKYRKNNKAAKQRLKEDDLYPWEDQQKKEIEEEEDYELRTDYGSRFKLRYKIMKFILWVSGKTGADGEYLLTTASSLELPEPECYCIPKHQKFTLTVPPLIISANDALTIVSIDNRFLKKLVKIKKKRRRKDNNNEMTTVSKLIEVL